MPSGVDLFSDLSPVESLLVRDAQCFYQSITAEGLQTVHPYLPADRAEQILQTLVERKVLEQVLRHTYRYSPSTLAQVQDTERAILTYAGTLPVLLPEQAERLAVLTTALIDMINYGPNPAATPIFALVNRSLVPSEHPQGQIQQRLVSLLAYRDDAHIAAWRAEGYSAPAVRLATYLFRRTEPVSPATMLTWPLFYDERYLQAALDELLTAANVEITEGGYRLNVKGMVRREKVEALTDDYFRATFEGRISENGRRQWMTLMMLLAEGGKIASQSKFSMSTISLPMPLSSEVPSTSNLSEAKPKT